MSAVDTFVPSLTQRSSLALEEERGEVSGGTSGHLDGVRVGNFVSWSTAQIHPQNSRVLEGSRVYQPTWEKRMP